MIICPAAPPKDKFSHAQINVCVCFLYVFCSRSARDPYVRLASKRWTKHKNVNGLMHKTTRLLPFIFAKLALSVKWREKSCGKFSKHANIKTENVLVCQTREVEPRIISLENGSRSRCESYPFTMDSYSVHSRKVVERSTPAVSACCKCRRKSK